MKPMEIRKNISNQSCELIVTGRIDGAMANQLEVEVLDCERQGMSEIFINLSEATFLCSAAIRVLLQHYRQMKNSGKKFLVTRPSAEAASALETTGFTALIER
jgi:anti-anti-sigma factor